MLRYAVRQSTWLVGRGPCDECWSHAHFGQHVCPVRTPARPPGSGPLAPRGAQGCRSPGRRKCSGVLVPRGGMEQAPNSWIWTQARPPSRGLHHERVRQEHDQDRWQCPCSHVDQNRRAPGSLAAGSWCSSARGRRHTLRERCPVLHPALTPSAGRIVCYLLTLRTAKAIEPVLKARGYLSPDDPRLASRRESG